MLNMLLSTCPRSNQKPKCCVLLKLQTSSMCPNGRWRGFVSATKRLATSMIDPGRADLARQLLETTACWFRLTAPGGVDASDACFIKNCTSDSCLQWSPRSYCCPETSAKQETAKKLCCVLQGPQPDGRLDSRKCDSSDQSSAPPILSTTLGGPSGPTVHPNLEVESFWFGLHSIRTCLGDL